jgi:hypothetical protein
MSISAIKTVEPNFNLVRETYGFINTGSIVERFERQGWTLASARQVKVKDSSREGYQRHLLRFQNESFSRIDGLSNDNASIPELIVENSHDGTGALKVFFGVFRLACLNGIIAGASVASMRVIHSKNSIKNIDEAIDNMTAGIPDLVKRVNRFAGIQLPQEKRIELAHKAAKIRLSHVKGVTFNNDHAAAALKPKRWTDTGFDAFSTFNILQEKVIRGGLIYLQETQEGRSEWRTSRAISSVGQSVKLNRELWEALEAVTV